MGTETKIKVGDLVRPKYDFVKVTQVNERDGEPDEVLLEGWAFPYSVDRLEGSPEQDRGLPRYGMLPGHNEDGTNRIVAEEYPSGPWVKAGDAFELIAFLRGELASERAARNPDVAKQRDEAQAACRSLKVRVKRLEESLSAAEGLIDEQTEEIEGLKQITEGPCFEVSGEKELSALNKALMELNELRKEQVAGSAKPVPEPQAGAGTVPWMHYQSLVETMDKLKAEHAAEIRELGELVAYNEGESEKWLDVTGERRTRSELRGYIERLRACIKDGFIRDFDRVEAARDEARRERDEALARVAELETVPDVAFQEWDSGRLSSKIPSNWSQASTVTLWSEDDAPVPDKENHRQAWARLFGTDIRAEKPLATEDFGDQGSALYSRGRVLCSAFDGCRIEQLQFMPDEREEVK
jgi:hypothetical protein